MGFYCLGIRWVNFGWLLPAVHHLGWINYDFFTIYLRFVGTHEEYDAIDAQTI